METYSINVSDNLSTQYNRQSDSSLGTHTQRTSSDLDKILKNPLYTAGAVVYPSSLNLNYLIETAEAINRVSQYSSQYSPTSTPAESFTASISSSINPYIDNIIGDIQKIQPETASNSLSQEHREDSNLQTCSNTQSVFLLWVGIAIIAFGISICTRITLSFNINLSCNDCFKFEYQQTPIKNKHKPCLKEKTQHNLYHLNSL